MPANRPINPDQKYGDNLNKFLIGTIIPYTKIITKNKSGY